MREAAVPPSGAVWWRLQMRAYQDAAARHHPHRNARTSRRPPRRIASHPSPSSAASRCSPPLVAAPHAPRPVQPSLAIAIAFFLIATPVGLWVAIGTTVERTATAPNKASGDRRFSPVPPRCIRCSMIGQARRLSPLEPGSCQHAGMFSSNRTRFTRCSPAARAGLPERRRPARADAGVVHQKVLDRVAALQKIDQRASTGTRVPTKTGVPPGFGIGK